MAVPRFSQRLRAVLVVIFSLFASKVVLSRRFFDRRFHLRISISSLALISLIRSVLAGFGGKNQQKISKKKRHRPGHPKLNVLKRSHFSRK
jgi:hypothetical protein